MLKQPENLDKAYDYAVYLLSLRLRTEGELREKMKVKKYQPEIIELVIAKLLDSHYIDDQKYAQVYLENLKKYKNFGFYGIKKKMMEKKLPPALIEQVLQEGLPLAEELKIAGRLLKKEGMAVRVSDRGAALENTYNTFNNEISTKKQKLSQS